MSQPAERILRFTVVPNEVTIVDTADMLSQLNRRAYRQGMEYAYDRLEMFQNQSQSAAELTVYRLPQTWVSANTWVKAFSVWRHQRMEAMDDSDSWSMEAAYADFKIYYNESHYSGTTPGGTNVNNAQPIECFTASAALAIDPESRTEWQYANFQIPYATSAAAQHGGMLGPDVSDYRGLIHNYALSRARVNPEDPSIVDATGAGQFSGGLFNQMRASPTALTEDIIENIQSRNDSPPYVVGGVDSAFEFYLGGSQNPITDYVGTRVDRLICTSSSILTSDSTAPFTAYLGLLYIYMEGDDNVECQLTCSPGSYKGVAARVMQDVN